MHHACMHACCFGKHLDIPARDFSFTALLYRLAVLQEGQLILSEGAALDASAKFYMIESGTVDCFRTFEVSLRSLCIVVTCRGQLHKRTDAGAGLGRLERLLGSLFSTARLQ